MPYTTRIAMKENSQRMKVVKCVNLHYSCHPVIVCFVRAFSGNYFMYVCVGKGRKEIWFRKRNLLWENKERHYITMEQNQKKEQEGKKFHNIYIE